MIFSQARINESLNDSYFFSSKNFFLEFYTILIYLQIKRQTLLSLAVARVSQEDRIL